MDPQKLSALDKIIKTDSPNLAGLVVCHNGRRELEAYYNDFTAEHQFHVFSVTKSIVSLLIGIALERGEITGVDQKILDFFPEFPVRKGHELLREVTLKHCLTMTVPYRFRFNPYTKYFTSDDWVSFALNQIGGREPLGKFRYAPIIGPDILSGILMSATGKTVLDYAREHLFDPLGITIEKSLFFETKEEQMAFYKAATNSCWVCGPNEINTAGWGLTLSAREMAAIGECCIHGGQVDGKQIIPQAWLKESTRTQSCWEKRNLNYGYLWWIVEEAEPSFAALGDGGNAIYVNPQNNLVVAIASTFVPRVKDRIDFIRGQIEPLFCE